MTYRLIGNDRQRGLKWAIPMLDAGVGHWDDASCLILEKDGDITAVAVYNRWYPKKSVEISIASVGGKWLTRPFLAAVFGNPFINWEMPRVGASIAEDNHKSIRFCGHLGFLQEGRIREAAPNGGDLILFGMLKSECRFLGGKVGQAFAATSARSDCDGSSANCV